MKDDKRINRKWRLGNFTVKEQGAYIEASDFAGVWKLKAHKATPLGLNLIGLCVHSPQTADVYVKLLWALGNIIPDTEYLEDLWNCYQRCLSRLPKEEDRGDEAEIGEVEKLEAFMNMPEDMLNEELDRVEAEFDAAMAEKRKNEEKDNKEKNVNLS